LTPRPLLRRVAESAAEARERLARFDRRRQRRLRVTPAFYDLEYEPLTLRTEDQIELAAWFVPAQPPDGRRRGLGALMHHHYGGQKAAMLPWLELFSRLGVDCLAFDARAHGGSSCRADQETYHQRFADVRAAHAELRRRGAERLLGFGQSQGGAVLVGALAASPDLVCLVLDSGPSATALPSLWGLARLIMREKPAPSVPPGPSALTTAMLAARLYARTGPTRYPLFLWRGLWRLRNRPLLWLHGTADDVIERHRAARWYDRIRPHAPSWAELTVPGAAHVQCLQHGPAEVERAVRALLGRIGPSPLLET
jgi:pimeloyl-ACP methyl ester carboxylesterase